MLGPDEDQPNDVSSPGGDSSQGSGEQQPDRRMPVREMITNLL